MILTGTFSAALAALPLVAHNRRERLACDTPFEWIRLALATYAASRIVAREKVGSFIRDPLVDAALPDEALEQAHNGGHSASTSELLAQQQTWQAAFAELVTCTRCVGVWNATVLTYLRALSPSHGRVVIDVLSVVGANNFLQALFAHLAERANAAARAEGPGPAGDTTSSANGGGASRGSSAPRTQAADRGPGAAGRSRS